jgi:hypothetical protein
MGIGAVGKIAQAIQMMKQEKQQQNQANQMFQVSGLTARAASSRPEKIQRKYVRPEDSLVNANQVGPSFGTNTNFLQLEDGGAIGGNPSEIMNVYNPGDIYSNLGYEPMGESVKQYQAGGFISSLPAGDLGNLGNSLGSLIGGGHGQQTGGGVLGSTIGSTVGSIIPIPGASQVLGLVGGLIGGIAGGKGMKRTEDWNKQSLKNMQGAAFQQAAQNIQGQNAAFMKDGGWVSHDWTPQLIAKWGDVDAQDVDKIFRPKEMNTLRAGGNISHMKENYMGDDERLQMMPMGGQLRPHWGGDLELMSYNPYMPGNGETWMPRGQSHEESDGRGNTGIGISYGRNMVEAERGEPIAEMEEGGGIDKSAVVYGNMKIPSYGASELNDPSAKGRKFKHYVADLSKKEAKQNKIIDKSTDVLDETETGNPFDQLRFSAAQAMLTGANMKLKDIADKKQMAAAVQNAILETAEEHGLESDALAKGKIQYAKFGGKMTAQSGKNIKRKKYQIAEVSHTPYELPNVSTDIVPPLVPTEIEMSDELKQQIIDDKKEREDRPKMIAKAVMSEISPFLRPSNRMNLDPNQLMGEMYALSQNQLEPVQAQEYHPMLETPYKVSYQDILNKNQADFNAMQKQVGYNPSALSTLAAQKYSANAQAIAEQERQNMGLAMGTYNKNREVLNDATLKNLAILDTQYARQSEAKSKTKQQAQVALNSIADKIAKNKLENRTLGVYENLYNYRFGPQGQAYNVNAPAEFNIPELAGVDPEALRNYGEKYAEEKAKKSKSKEARNGSIVKAIKNL